MCKPFDDGLIVAIYRNYNQLRLIDGFVGGIKLPTRQIKKPKSHELENGKAPNEPTYVSLKAESENRSIYYYSILPIKMSALRDIKRGIQKNQLS